MASNNKLSSTSEQNLNEDESRAFTDDNDNAEKSPTTIEQQDTSHIERIAISDQHIPHSNEENKSVYSDGALPSTSNSNSSQFQNSLDDDDVPEISRRNEHATPYEPRLMVEPYFPDNDISQSNQRIPKTPGLYYLQNLYNVTKDCEGLSFEEYVHNLVKVLKVYDPLYDFKSALLKNKNYLLYWRQVVCKPYSSYDDVLKICPPSVLRNMYTKLNFFQHKWELQTAMTDIGVNLFDGTSIVCWDIENLFPKRKHLIKVVEKLRTTYSEEAKVYVAISETCPMFKEVFFALKQVEGVEVMTVKPRTDAADKKLQEVMVQFSNECCFPARVVLLTGDHGFLKTMKELGDKKIEIVLIHKSDAPDELKKAANECTTFKEFIRDIPNIPEEHSVVLNIPEDMKKETLQVELEKLCEGNIKLKLSYMSQAVKVTFKSADELNAFHKAVDGRKLPGSSRPLHVV